jgi:hypothetical protein
MMPNKTYELRNLYFQQNPCHEDSSNYAYPSILQWPSNGYFNSLRPDSELLKESLVPTANESASVSDQIFGNEMKQQHFTLKHLSNLFYERCRLHKNHLDDIRHRHLQIQTDLYSVVINKSPDKAKRQSNLESQLLQLENSKREEELAFWKDSADLREKLFETAGLYKNAKNRYSIFSGMEEEYDRQG